MVPPHVCIVPPHVKCLHVLYDSYGSPIPYMECRNLVAVNDLWSPIPHMECGNLVTVNDYYGPLYFIWNAGTF